MATSSSSKRRRQEAVGEAAGQCVDDRAAGQEALARPRVGGREAPRRGHHAALGAGLDA